MFEAILKTFLDNAEEDELFIFGHIVFGTFRGDGDGEETGAGDTLTFFFGGLADAKGADMTGVEATGEVTQVADGAGDIVFGGGDGLVVDGVGLADAAELDLRETEQLTDIVMYLFADMCKGLLLHFKTGQHQLLIELGLHLLLLYQRLSAAVVVVDQHYQEQDAKEEQYKKDCNNSRCYLLVCIRHKKKAQL